jgi:hypothetical protein
VGKALRHKPTGRGFDSRWCHLEFFVDIILPVALWPWGSTHPLTEMSTNVFPGGKRGRCVGLTTLPPSCAVVMKSGNLNYLEPSGPLPACNGTAYLLLFCYKTLHVSGIFSAHHQEFSTVHSALVNFMQLWWLLSGRVHSILTLFESGHQNLTNVQ